MVTKDELEKIKALKDRGYSQGKIATTLKISRSTVARHWGRKRLTFDDLFSLAKCNQCGTLYPKPKFIHSWNCPYCGRFFTWNTKWFSPEGKVIEPEQPTPEQKAK